MNTTKPTTIYQKLLAAGCAVEGHESDLYTPATDAAAAIIWRNRGQHQGQVTTFKGSDGRLWFDVPFAFDPFWANRFPALEAVARA